MYLKLVLFVWIVNVVERVDQQMSCPNSYVRDFTCCPDIVGQMKYTLKDINVLNLTEKDLNTINSTLTDSVSYPDIVGQMGHTMKDINLMNLIEKDLNTTNTNLTDFVSCPDSVGQMGYTLRDIDLVNLTEKDLNTIKAALLKHGVIVFRNQSMTRKQQFDFTQKLGQLIPLPKFLNLKDPEVGFEDKILRVTNYDSKGLPKQRKELNGQYWHKDGDYKQNDYIGSILYADEIDSMGDSRDTLFLDNCFMEVYPKPLLDQVKHLANEIDVSMIKDFIVTVEDLKQFPPVFPKVISKHPGNGKDCLYLTEHLTMVGNISQKERKSVEQLWDIMIKKAPKYAHQWREGDVVIWDNLAVMHRTGPITKQVVVGKRKLYRTMYLIGEKMSGV